MTQSVNALNVILDLSALRHDEHECYGVELGDVLASQIVGWFRNNCDDVDNNNDNFYLCHAIIRIRHRVSSI